MYFYECFISYFFALFCHWLHLEAPSPSDILLHWEIKAIYLHFVFFTFLVLVLSSYYLCSSFLVEHISQFVSQTAPGITFLLPANFVPLCFTSHCLVIFISPVSSAFYYIFWYLYTVFMYTILCNTYIYIYISVQLLCGVQLFATTWTAACQASLSITNSWSLLKLMSIELVMPSSHLILCRPLLPSIFPSVRVFSSESVLCIRWPKY